MMTLLMLWCAFGVLSAGLWLYWTRRSATPFQATRWIAAFAFFAGGPFLIFYVLVLAIKMTWGS